MMGILSLKAHIGIRKATRAAIVTDIPIIAIVDDDEGIREALDDLVKSCGYDSRLFASAEEFLAYQPDAPIDCMLVDVKMPGLSGIDLQRELNLRDSRPPMIFMTSYRDDRTRNAAMDGGAHAFLGKPVNIDQLIGSLRSALGH